MFLTIHLLIMTIIFTAFAWFHGRGCLILAVGNAIMAVLCALWVGFRIFTGQHPTELPQILTEDQIAEIVELPPEVIMSLGIGGSIAALLVWAIFDAQTRRN